MTGTRKPKSCLARWSASPGVRTCEESGVGDPVVSVHGVVAQVSALQVAVIGAEHERHRTQVPRCRLSGFFQSLENLAHSNPIQSLCFMSNLCLIFILSELVRIQPEGLGEGKSYGLVFPFLPFLSWLLLVCLWKGVREELKVFPYLGLVEIFLDSWGFSGKH